MALVRDAAGEDRFDCVLGVLCVLNVLGRQSAGHRAGGSMDPPLGGLGAGADRAAGRKKRRATQDAPKVVFGNGHTLT